MISGDEIKYLIQHPHDIDKNQLAEIDLLIEKYPYSSSLYILRMIGSGKTNDLNFEGRLKIAASNVSDRAHLHNLLSKPAETASEKIIEESDEPVTIDIPEEHTSDLVDSKENEEISEVSSGQLEETEDLDETEATELADLSAQIVTSVVETALQVDAAESTEIEVLEEDAEEQEEPPFADETDREDEELLIEQEIEEEERDLEIELAAEELEEEELEDDSAIEIIRPENLTFIEWLKYKQSVFQGEPKKKSKRKKVSKEKEKKKKKKKKKADKKKDKNVLKESKSMSKKEINDLLDKFIEEEPTMSSPTKDFYNPTVNAKKSVEESVDIVSETLAQIHVMQGNYGKAINTYKQLCLLYPEKKTFFADQIEKIKGKLKQ